MTLRSDCTLELRQYATKLYYQTSGSCDRASLTQEKKETTDDTSKDVYSLQINSACFGIIMPIVRRQTVQNRVWCQPGCAGCGSVECDQLVS